MAPNTGAHRPCPLHGHGCVDTVHDHAVMWGSCVSTFRTMSRLVIHEKSSVVLMYALYLLSLSASWVIKAVCIAARQGDHTPGFRDALAMVQP